MKKLLLASGALLALIAAGPVMAGSLRGSGRRHTRRHQSAIGLDFTSAVMVVTDGDTIYSLTPRCQSTVALLGFRFSISTR